MSLNEQLAELLRRHHADPTDSSVTWAYNRLLARVIGDPQPVSCPLDENGEPCGQALALGMPKMSRGHTVIPVVCSRASEPIEVMRVRLDDTPNPRPGDWLLTIWTLIEEKLGENPELRANVRRGELIHLIYNTATYERLREKRGYLPKPK